MRKTARKSMIPVAMAASLSLMAMQAVATPAICSSSGLAPESYTLAPDLIVSNVPTCDGAFVSGFQILSNPVEWYVDAHHADRCFNMDVTFLPEDVSAYDEDAVSEFLGDRKVDFFKRVTVITCD